MRILILKSSTYSSFFLQAELWDGKFQKGKFWVFFFLLLFLVHISHIFYFYFDKKGKSRQQTAEVSQASTFAPLCMYNLDTFAHQSLLFLVVSWFARMSQTMMMIKIKVIWSSKIKSMEIILLICTKPHKVFFTRVDITKYIICVYKKILNGK